MDTETAARPCTAGDVSAAHALADVRSSRRCCSSRTSTSARRRRSCSRPRTSSAPARSSCAARWPSSPRSGTRLPDGVVAGSAGNHAQSLAYAARARGVPARCSCPATRRSPRSTRRGGLGAVVHRSTARVDDCVAAGAERASEAGMAFVHPFDDPDVIAGQATLGLELLEDVPDLAKVVVPVGGGGLAAGVAIAVKSARPEVEVVGVQVEAVRALSRVAAARRARAGRLGADDRRRHRGQAPGRPHAAAARAGGSTTSSWSARTTWPRRWSLLIERCQARRRGRGRGRRRGAARRAGTPPAAAARPSSCSRGGNVDAGLLAAIARRHETEAGRRLVLLTRVPTAPARWRGCSRSSPRTGANLVEVAHVREGLGPPRPRDRASSWCSRRAGAITPTAVSGRLATAGYDARVLH